MSKRKKGENHIRKIQVLGNSYAVTLPLEMVKSLGWRKKQKVVVRLEGESLVIEDWK